MCGIFGYIGENPNINKIKYVAELASKRGVHSCGWALWKNNSFEVHKKIGVMRNYLHLLEPSNIIIGHSRLSTMGGQSYKALEEAQPITKEVFKDYLITQYPIMAHNGVISDFIPNETLRTDSQLVYGFILDGIDIDKKILEPYAILWSDGKILKAFRNDLPLFYSDGYFCSVEFDNSRLIDKNICIKLSLNQ